MLSRFLLIGNFIGKRRLSKAKIDIKTTGTFGFFLVFVLFMVFNTFPKHYSKNYNFIPFALMLHTVIERYRS